MAYRKHTFTAGQVLTATVMTQIDTELKNVSDKEESLENDFAILKADCESSQAITENRVDAFVTGSSYTEYGKKAVAKGTFTYSVEIEVQNGNVKKTYSGTSAPCYASNTVTLKITGIPDGTNCLWKYKNGSNPWKDSTLPGYNTDTLTFTTNGDSAKRICYLYKCIMNGKYESGIITMIDTGWKNIAPTCSVSGNVVSVGTHNVVKAPDGLCYDVRVNGVSMGTIEWSETASERTLTLTTAPGEDDLVEVVPFVTRGTDAVSTMMEVSD